MSTQVDLFTSVQPTSVSPAIAKSIVSGSFIGDELLKDIPTSTSPFICVGVVIGLPFDLKCAIQYYGKEIIPDCLGIYHLFYEDQLIYVGMSKNLRGRLLCHLKDKDMPFNNVLWFCADTWKESATIEDVLRIEYKMIKKFKPALNRVHTNCRQRWRLAK